MNRLDEIEKRWEESCQGIPKKVSSFFEMAKLGDGGYVLYQARPDITYLIDRCRELEGAYIRLENTNQQLRESMSAYQIAMSTKIEKLEKGGQNLLTAMWSHCSGSLPMSVEKEWYELEEIIINE